MNLFTKQKTGFFLAGAALLFLTVSAPVSAQRSEKRKNVIFVDICSARADHMGLYGYKRDTTPNIDSVAGEAAVFDRAVSMSSWCLPNYASLFTGHTPEVHGQYVNIPYRPMPSFEVTLAEKMKAAGYATAAFSGGIYFMKPWGMDKGFDKYENVFSTSSPAPGTFSQTMPGVMDWVDKQGERPFFLFIAVDDIHVPFQAEEPHRYDPGYSGLVDDDSSRSVPFFRDYNRYMRGELPADASNYAKAAEFAGDARHLRNLTARYDAAMRTADARVGTFISYLKDKGLWDNSAVFISADHGEQLGEHGLLGHTEGLYEPITHVPLLIHDPARPWTYGKRLGQLVERVDMMPTILDMAGVPYAGLELQGRSLTAVLDDPAAELRQYAYSSNKRNLPVSTDLLIDERVIRDGRWKLHWYLHKNRYELYDLEKDPLETKDLSLKRPDILGRLAFELLRKVEEVRPHGPGLPSGNTPEVVLNEKQKN